MDQDFFFGGGSIHTSGNDKKKEKKKNKKKHNHIYFLKLLIRKFFNFTTDRIMKLASELSQFRFKILIYFFFKCSTNYFHFIHFKEKVCNLLWFTCVKQNLKFNPDLKLNSYIQSLNKDSGKLVSALAPGLSCH